MQVRPIRCRRARRTDLTDILRLLAHSDRAVPVPDRAMLRRFRRIVSDLGTDLYVALIGERTVGFVQISYHRDITLGARGRVDSLVVAGAEGRTRELLSSLVRVAEQRARRHNCVDLSYTDEIPSTEASEVLAATGWVATGKEIRLSLSQSAKEPGSD